MSVLAKTVLLLTLSNVFMTFAWYAHLKHLNQKPWIVAALVSWGIALFEYLLQVPANRIGHAELQPGPAQDPPGGHHARRVRAVRVALHEGTGEAQLPLGRALPVRRGFLRVPQVAGRMSRFSLRGAWRLIPALLLLAGMEFAPRPAHPTWNAVFDSGHAVLFGVVALVFLGWLRSEGVSGWKSFGIALLAAAATGAASEALQFPGPRDADPIARPETVANDRPGRNNRKSPGRSVARLTFNPRSICAIEPITEAAATRRCCR